MSRAVRPMVRGKTIVAPPWLLLCTSLRFAVQELTDSSQEFEFSERGGFYGLIHGEHIHCVLTLSSLSRRRLV